MPTSEITKSIRWRTCRIYLSSDFDAHSDAFSGSKHLSDIEGESRTVKSCLSEVSNVSSLSASWAGHTGCVPRIMMVSSNVLVSNGFKNIRPDHPSQNLRPTSSSDLLMSRTEPIFITGVQHFWNVSQELISIFGKDALKFSNMIEFVGINEAKVCDSYPCNREGVGKDCKLLFNGLDEFGEKSLMTFGVPFRNCATTILMMHRYCLHLQ